MAAAGREVRVVKLGGSLLDLPELIGVLGRWLAQQTPAANVMLTGGGRVADAVREYDRLHGLGDVDAHWLAIRAMELNSRLLASLLKESVWLDAWDSGAGGVAPNRTNPNRERENAPISSLAILNPHQFMREDARAADPLPASWHVTSDSIAARAAEHTRASELVLLKSALPPSQETVEDAAAAGFVDRMFAEASRRVPRIRLVNLREPGFPEVVWRGRALEGEPKKE